MTVTITTEEVVAALKQAVADRGTDFNYKEHYGIAAPDTCHYVEIDVAAEAIEPGCLVGYVLHRSFGVPLEQFAPYEGMTVEELGFLEADEEAEAILSEAQRRQDEGYSWGEAVDVALASVK